MLIQVILQQGLSGTPTEVRAALNTYVDLPHNHELWTYNGVANAFGDQAAEGLAQAMTTAGLTTAVMVYASKGFDLSLQQTQDKLDAIAAGVPPLADVCEALKAIGRPTKIRWDHVGLLALPTENDILLAQQAIADGETIDNLRSLATGCASYTRQFQEVFDELMQAARNNYGSLSDAKTAVLDDARTNIVAIDALITRLTELKAELQ